MIDLLKQYVDGIAKLSPYQMEKLPRNLFVTYMRKLTISDLYNFKKAELLSVIGKRMDWLTDDQMIDLYSINGENLFSYVINPSERTQLFMVTVNPKLIENILKNGIIPSEKVQLRVVKHNGYNIKILTDYGINPSEDVQREAIWWDNSYIDFIPNPHPNIINQVNKYKK
jgi:hypothetical protein